jgi:2-C-methyl-D-erythritol 4-phosphate cytidylyltransferase
VTGADLAIVLVAAGSSERMGFDKLRADLGGRPLLAWSVETALAADPATLVVVAAPERVPEVTDLVRAAAGSQVDITVVVPGGPRRRDSVARGVAATRGEQWIAVHDAARPFAASALYQAGYEAAQESGAAVPGVSLKDTVKRLEGRRVVETPPRASLVAIQTPQVFRRELLQQALERTADDVTDEAVLVEQTGVVVHVFPGEERNFKVTTPMDLLLARAVVRERAQEPVRAG